MWRANWDDAGAKVIRQPHSENRLYIVTNTILDAEPIPMLTLPGQAVFTRLSPDINRAFAGNSQYKNQKVKQLNLENHPQIGKYIIQYYGCVGDGCMPQVAVYLTPNGKLPIRQLTKGEVLDRIEQAIPAERRGIESLMPNEKQVAVERVRTHIETLRKKYSNSLNMPAYLRNSDLDMTDIFNRDDILIPTMPINLRTILMAFILTKMACWKKANKTNRFGYALAGNQQISTHSPTILKSTEA
jgi:hypothetical protein